MQLVPGLETMLVISRGAAQGWRVAFWTVLGMTLVAGAIQLPLLIFGVAAAVQSSPVVLKTLRLMGAIYLMALGARLLLKATPIADSASRQAARLSAMREGAAINLSNPNSILFMLLFLPQFVEPARGPVTLQLMLLGVTQKVMGFAVLICTALASGAVGKWLKRHPKGILWQQRLAGAAILAIGAYFLLG